MSNQRLACAKDKVFRDPQGRPYAPGQLLSDDQIESIGEDRIKSLIKKGRIVSVDLDIPVIEPKKSVDQQRIDEGQVSPSKYDLDPSDLENLDLDELCLLALDIDEDSRGYDSREEAISALSKDYKAPEAGN